MENKYYTPTLEEFHVGFEYEAESTQYPDKNNWHPETFYMNEGHFNLVNINTLHSKKVRVKHLDREDIASFGFKQITDDCYHLPVKEFRGRLNQEVRILVRKTILIYLAMDITDKDNIVLFTGTIKNKSELKKLMNQLGIIKNKEDERNIQVERQ